MDRGSFFLGSGGEQVMGFFQIYSIVSIV